MLQSGKSIAFQSILDIWLVCNTKPFLFIVIFNIHYGIFGIKKSDFRYLIETDDSKSGAKKQKGVKFGNKRNEIQKKLNKETR